MDFFSALKLICGLSFFLFGMKVLSENLKKMAGGALENSLKKMVSNPFLSMGIGAVLTIAMQSSSAATVMLVGLVNSGLMLFSETVYVIFGANIGTTLTSWLLSLTGISGNNVFIGLLKPVNFSALLAFVGICMIMLSKKDKYISLGNVFLGFTVLMYGMAFMSDSVAPLSNAAWFPRAVATLENPVLAVFIGTAFTAIIQSSAAALGVLQALSLTGVIPFSVAIPLILGINIGTCATALISCIGTGTNAKRVAALHLEIKIIGVTVLLALYELLNAVIGFSFSATMINPVYIAVVHTLFNVLTTIFLMPFNKKLVLFTKNIVRGHKKSASSVEEMPGVIDERLYSMPSVALNECNNLSIKMASLAQKNIKTALSLITEYDEKKVNLLNNNEDIIDKYEDILGTALVSISSNSISSSDTNKASRILHAIVDFERLGDHAENIMQTAVKINKEKINFSEKGYKELDVLFGAIKEIVGMSVKAYKNNDVELATDVEPLEQVIDGLTAKMKDNHVRRLQQGKCMFNSGFAFSDIINDIERISDHCSNVAAAVIELSHSSFDTHKYLNDVKFNDNDFKRKFDVFSEKYNV